jgi:hypothetical protein
VPGTPTVAKQAVSLSGTKLIGVDGNEVQLRGINVFGFENGVTAPDGIWQVRSLDMSLSCGTVTSWPSSMSCCTVLLPGVGSPS